MTIAREAIFLSFALGVVVAPGCSGPETGQTEATTAAVETASAPTDESPGAMNVATGTVVETLDAASYTYVRVDVGDEEIWAATSTFAVAVGDRVTVPLDMPMEDFHSPALDRRFPVIYFAGQILREGEQAAPVLPQGHPPVGGAAVSAAGSGDSTPVEPADDGLTVAQVWARRTELAGNEVTVRGRVVKVNHGILGRNWLHLQDGTGAQEQGTHDLTVTSDGTAPTGSVVTVTGTVAVDRDFGAGYSYALMLENAKVAPSE